MDSTFLGYMVKSSSPYTRRKAEARGRGEPASASRLPKVSQEVTNPTARVETHRHGGRGRLAGTFGI